ncbi:DUF2145 domain-containing protein [Variovorax sp. EBFNA2]|uniref:DUF2145 domain-containing protein n=1 Tax=Variovorax sp. EBFNA2 TaxID=3342097 RepID=UPI0029BFCEE2|nr:DUF2145 domain-containing protein [Variovorax boronicumulans]WPG37540.1 DUF2145 domain-containing protein [Variovorax boronicumulans]
MKPAVRPALLLAFAVAAVLPQQANAGRSCEQVKPTPALIVKGMQLAERTSQQLDASGARVVILARAGQDLSKYGLRYSHLGIAYKTDEGPWRVLHKLNHCGTAVAAVYRQGLGEFFLDDLWRYEAAWSVPAPAVQTQLLAALREPDARLVRLNVAPYSIVSYAWGQKYQQSNQWALETLAAAMEPATIGTRAQAQAWLQFKGYEPTTLNLGPLTRLGGRVGSANIAFDDHPNEKRFSDRIETVTVDSVFSWLPRAGLGAAPVTLKL